MVIIADKQQELYLPNQKADEGDGLSQHIRRKDTARAPMLEISGVRNLSHANNLQVDNLPKYGVEATDDKELQEVFILSCSNAHMIHRGLNINWER